MSGAPDGPDGPDGRLDRPTRQEDPPSARISDGELWKRAVAGDPDSFGIIFDRHGNAVHGYCARRTGSRDAADDMVSIVFLEAWRRRNEVELIDDKVLPWLYGIAGRSLQRHWRTARRHRAALQRLPASTLGPDHADEVAARLDDQRQLTQLHTTFARLRPADQEVLTLCVWEGLDYASAAVALGVPIGTVRSRLSRARARLRTGDDPPAPPPSASNTRVPARTTPASQPDPSLASCAVTTSAASGTELS